MVDYQKPIVGYLRMTKIFNEPVGFRFSKYLMKKIDRLIEEREFKNRSDVVRTATIEFLYQFEPGQEKQPIEGRMIK